MEDKELVKLFNPTLKKKDTILFFLIVVINGLMWIDSNIRLSTYLTLGEGKWWSSNNFVRHILSYCVCTDTAY